MFQKVNKESKMYPKYKYGQDIEGRNEIELEKLIESNIRAQGNRLKRKCGRE